MLVRINEYYILIRLRTFLNIIIKIRITAQCSIIEHWKNWTYDQSISLRYPSIKIKIHATSTSLFHHKNTCIFV